MSNIGLGFLTTQNPTDTITKGADAKIMTINDCVLENVMIDYAPNGWAAYNDGYPIQTRLTLSFKETKIVTKEDIKNSKVSTNAAEGPGATFNKAVDYANSPGNSGWLDF